MKRLLNILTTSAAVALLGTSCKENELPFQPNEFSDVSFINSQIYDEFGSIYVDVGSAVNFMDLSQNATSHIWEITDGCNFIGGDYSVEDADLSGYIINAGSNTSTDQTIGVLFTEAGEHSVRLFNLFDEQVSFTGYEYGNEVTIYSEWSSEYNAQVFDHSVEFVALSDVSAGYKVYRGVDTTGELLLEVGVDDTDVSTSRETINLTAGESLTYEIHEDCDGSNYNEILWTFTKGSPITTATNEKTITVTYPSTGSWSNSLGTLWIKRNSSSNANFKSTEKSNSRGVPLSLVVSAPNSDPIVISESNISSISGDNFIKINLGVYIDDGSDLTSAAGDFTISGKDWNGDNLNYSVTSVELEVVEKEDEAGGIALSRAASVTGEGTSSTLIVYFDTDEKLYADDQSIVLTYTNNGNIIDLFGRVIDDFTMDIKPEIETFVPDWAESMHSLEDRGEYNSQSSHKGFVLSKEKSSLGSTSLHYSKANVENYGPTSISSAAALIYYIGVSAPIQPITFEPGESYLCTFDIYFVKGLSGEKLQMRIKTETSQQVTDINFDFDTEDSANWNKWHNASVVITYPSSFDESYESSLSLKFTDTYTHEVPDTEFYVDNIEVYKDGKTTRAQEDYDLGFDDMGNAGDL